MPRLFPPRVDIDGSLSVLRNLTRGLAVGSVDLIGDVAYNWIVDGSAEGMIVPRGCPVPALSQRPSSTFASSRASSESSEEGGMTTTMRRVGRASLALLVLGTLSVGR